MQWSEMLLRVTIEQELKVLQKICDFERKYAFCGEYYIIRTFTKVR